MYNLHCRVRIENPLTLRKDLTYNLSVLSSTRRNVGSVVEIWNEDRSGTVEAEVYNVNATQRPPTTYKWNLA